MEKISILAPTRQRPGFVNDLVESCVNHAQHPELIEFVFYIDSDDDTYGDLSVLASKFNCDIKQVSGERIVLSQMWNECYKVCTGDILMHCGDDLRFRSENWDTVVRDKFNEFPDKIAFVFGNDGIWTPGEFGTHGFIHRNWAETVGYFVPPYFSSDYNDTWLNDVARGVGRWFYVDIYTEHLHPTVGKSAWDQNHQDRLKRHASDNVAMIYKAKLKERMSDVAKLQNYIKNFGVEQ